MSNHFQAVGLPIASAEDLSAFLKVAAEHARWARSPAGFYIHWGPDQGVEFWGQADPKRNLIGGHPHFVGPGRIRLAINGVVASDAAPLDGMIVGMVNPAPDGTGGDYPLAIDLCDFDCLRRAISQPGTIVHVQVAAFVEQGECFASDAEFASSAAGPPRLASEAVIPIGLFTPAGEQTSSPQPRMLASGHIQAAQRRANPFSGEIFWAISIVTFGGTYDVVADPKVLKGEPVLGGVFYGVCYLSGQIAPEARRKINGLPPSSAAAARSPEIERVTPHRRYPIFPALPGRTFKRLATIGLVLSMASIGCFPLAAAGALMSALALIGMARHRNPEGCTMAIIGLLVGCGVRVLSFVLIQDIQRAGQ